MSKKRIALLFGGKSGEHEVSIVSALSIYKALDKSKYDVVMVGIDKTGRWLLPDQSRLLAESENPRLIKLNEVKQTVSLLPFPAECSLIGVQNGTSLTLQNSSEANLGRIDAVLPILHGTYGEDGTMQGLLELANIPYVGSGVLGSSLCMDKDAAKRLLRDAGLPVVPFLTVRKSDYQRHAADILALAEKEFGYPYFVKPANMGSSVGVNKVKSAGEAKTKFEDALQYDTKILVEKGVNARELECSVLGNHDPEASIVGEIIPHQEFYTYDAKYIDENGAELAIPAQNLSNEILSQIQKYAVTAFKTLECAGLARVDFFLDRDTGEVFVNELNTIPGFTSISMYPKLWEASGLPYPKLLDRLIELAIERHREKNELKTSYGN